MRETRRKQETKETNNTHTHTQHTHTHTQPSTPTLELFPQRKTRRQFLSPKKPPNPKFLQI